MLIVFFLLLLRLWVFIDIQHIYYMLLLITEWDKTAIVPFTSLE